MFTEIRKNPIPPLIGCLKYIPVLLFLGFLFHIVELWPGMLPNLKWVESVLVFFFQNLYHQILGMGTSSHMLSSGISLLRLRRRQLYMFMSIKILERLTCMYLYNAFFYVPYYILIWSIIYVVCYKCRQF